MWHGYTDEPIRLNWTAILSFTGSLAVSIAVWAGLFRVVQLFVK